MTDLSMYSKNTLIISPLAGVRAEKIKTEALVCRIMPNILLQNNHGTTLVYKTEESESLKWFLSLLEKK